MKECELLTGLRGIMLSFSGSIVSIFSLHTTIEGFKLNCLNIVKMASLNDSEMLLR